jgi:3D (Asp-Asp-Asp) domain-containing protein
MNGGNVIAVHQLRPVLVIFLSLWLVASGQNFRAIASSDPSAGPLQVRAKPGGPAVHVAPDQASPSLSGLYFDTYLPVLEQRVDSAGVNWYRVELWGTLSGWIRAADTETGDPPPPTPVADEPSAGGAPPRSLRGDVHSIKASGTTNDEYNVRGDSSIDADSLSVVPAGTAVAIDGWQSDDDGSIWYHARTANQTGWIWAGGVDLNLADPTKTAENGRLVWSRAAGKGMWMPAPLMEMADPEAVVRAAKALGLTHIYLEVGDSSRGFYGRAEVDRLLPAAREAGISVIGWILTRLSDVSGDVNLSSEIAKYQTPNGLRLDGVAPDVEFNMDGSDVRAFSQILRALVGDDELVVGVIYPAGTEIAQNHPVANILDRSFNVLAPMDYWHDAQRDYSQQEIADFIRKSVDDVHAATGNTAFPVEVIGQSYDGFSRNGAGPSSPTGSEVAAAVASARDAGAVGVSLFQWGTTTPDEWNALRDLAWPARTS